MSTTIYDSPDGHYPSLSIDITHSTVWFFENDHVGHTVGEAKVALEELPAILRAIENYMAAAGIEKLKGEPPDRDEIERL